MAEAAQALDIADEAQFFLAIQRWLDKEVRPVVKKYDHADLYPTEIVEQMKELGLFGATIGAEYGGLGLPAKTYAKLVMQISSVWMAITGAPILTRSSRANASGTSRTRSVCCTSAKRSP